MSDPVQKGPARTAAPTGGPYLLAWLVHLLTASGAVLAFLALAAIQEENWSLALVWLVAALAIDGVDGSLARAVRVGERAARIDGPALDLIVDYLNYVFVPGVFIWRAGLIPEPWAIVLVAAILVSALYNFVRRDMKTDDHYFRGFPALWNVVALYLFVARPGPEAGAILVAFLAFMTFAPVHFVHPFRVREFRPWLAILALAWVISTGVLLWPHWSGALRQALILISGMSALLLVLAGLWRTVRGIGTGSGARPG